jgi:hypothetical protein
MAFGAGWWRESFTLKTCATLQAMHSITFFFSYFWFSSASGGREI